MKKKLFIAAILLVLVIGTVTVLAQNNEPKDTKSVTQSVVEKPKVEEKQADVTSVEEVVSTTPVRNTQPTTKTAVKTNNQIIEEEPAVVNPTMSIIFTPSSVLVTPGHGTHPVATISVQFNGQSITHPSAGDGIPVSFNLTGSGTAIFTVTDTQGNTATETRDLNI